MKYSNKIIIENPYNEDNNEKCFYDSITGQPIKPNQRSRDKNYQIVPEDDNIIKNPLLYEDLNLNPKEIQFFVLWNNFKDSHELNEKYDSHDTIEKFVNMFIKEKLDYIKENQLINELSLFLNFLLDIGEISFTFFYLWTIKINL